MISDLVVDFETHLKNGKVYLVELELGMLDHPDQSSDHITADVYVVAPNLDLAQYITTVMYPDYIGTSVYQDPITEEEYVSRRNRSVL